MNPLIAGSLFTGIGGFDLAAKRAGIKVKWQAEKDKDCLRLLAKRFPKVKRFEDVHDVGRSSAKPVDLICGGFPCQDLSVAGQRAGLAGERSGLWFEFARVIDELEPRWVVIENVPGLLSSWSPIEPPPEPVEGREWEVEEASDFEVILRWLAERGYGVAWRVLDAQYDGLAQRRERVFIVASLGSGRSAEILFESEGSPWDSAPGRTQGERVAAPLTRGSGVGSNDPGRRREDDENLVAHTLSAEGADASEDGTGRGTPLVARALRAQPNLAHREDVDTFVVGALHNGTPSRDASDAANGHLVAAHRGGHAPRYDLDNDTYVVGAVSAKWAKGTGGPSGDEAQNLVAFTQNTRDEVRMIGGDGQHTGAIGAERGMKQQTYIAFMAGAGAKARSLSESENTSPSVLSANQWEQRHSNNCLAWQQGVSENDRAYPVRSGEYSGALSQSRQDAVSGAFGVRRLTPTECERLQGFPDGWTAGQSDSARYRQLGNAVAVPVVEWIMKRIAKENQS